MILDPSEKTEEAPNSYRSRPEQDKKQVTNQQEIISNEIREAFGYHPGLTAKQVNYKVTKMPIKLQYQDLENHVVKKYDQYQPLQQLLQEERERIMVLEKGIDTAETTRFFIEKIKEYNSIIDLEHLRLDKKNYEALQRYLPQKLSNSEFMPRTEQMKRYTGDQGQITNFHFVINSQNLMPVFRELSEQVPQNLKQKSQPVRQKNKKKSPTFKQKQYRGVQRLESLFRDIEDKNQKQYSQLYQSKLQGGSGVMDGDSISKIQTSEIKIDTEFKVDSLIKPDEVISKVFSCKSGNSVFISRRRTPKPNLNLPLKNASVTKSTNKTPPNMSRLPTNAHTPIYSRNQMKRFLGESAVLQSMFLSEISQLGKKKKVYDSVQTSPMIPDSVLMTDKQRMVQKMINTSFDNSMMTNYLQGSMELKRAVATSQRYRRTNAGSFDLPPSQIVSEIEEKIIEVTVEDDLVVPEVETNIIVEVTNEQCETLPLVVQEDIKETIAGEVTVVVESFNLRLPQQLIELFNQPINYDAENLQRKRRQTVIDKLLTNKRPKYIHVGGTKFSVLNTPENVNLYSKIKQMSAHDQLQRDIQDERNQIESNEEEHDYMNMSGPPKKVKFGNSDLKQDYHDMKVSNMMKKIWKFQKQ